MKGTDPLTCGLRKGTDPLTWEGVIELQSLTVEEQVDALLERGVVGDGEALRAAVQPDR